MSAKSIALFQAHMANRPQPRVTGSVVKSLRTLSDKHLRDLHSLARSEVRRRKQIATRNATWTASTGLVDVMTATLEMKK